MLMIQEKIRARVPHVLESRSKGFCEEFNVDVLTKDPSAQFRESQRQFSHSAHLQVSGYVDACIIDYVLRSENLLASAIGSACT